MEYLLLIIGFVLLIKGADFFVEGSSSLARFLKIPSVIIGLTIVAMGTSAPEASVSINAALAGNNDIAVSNIIGSNIFNGLVVVGICAFIAGFKTNRDILKRDMPVNILITVILCIMIANGKLSRIEGILLLVGMIFYILNMIRTALKKRTECPAEQSITLYKALLFIIGGLAAVIFGGNLVVNNASHIAVSFGVSQNFIGLTIVQSDTSLPELVTSIVATRKGDSLDLHLEMQLIQTYLIFFLSWECQQQFHHFIFSQNLLSTVESSSSVEFCCLFLHLLKNL